MYLTFFEQLLTWLDGRKQKISAISAVIIGLLVVLGSLDARIGTALLAIINIVFGTTAVITDKVLGERNSLGQRVKVEQY